LSGLRVPAELGQSEGVQMQHLTAAQRRSLSEMMAEQPDLFDNAETFTLEFMIRTLRGNHWVPVQAVLASAHGLLARDRLARLIIEMEAIEHLQVVRWWRNPTFDTVRGITPRP
jgi:hypothetical protein